MYTQQHSIVFFKNIFYLFTKISYLAQNALLQLEIDCEKIGFTRPLAKKIK